MRPLTIFIAGLVAAILASAHPAAAQQAEKIHRIGYLSVRSPEAEKRYFPAFQQGLRELGYVEGENLVIEARYANGNNDRLANVGRRSVDRCPIPHSR